MRIAIVAGESLLVDPAGRPVYGLRGVLRFALALTIALGLAFGVGVLVGHYEIRIRQGIALALEENRALQARQGSLREQAAALEERLAASHGCGRLRILEHDAAR